MKKNIVIIGGGASGMFAAMRAAELGGDVVVLEKMDRPGRKLAITGKGRCNLTTGNDVETAIAAFGPNGRFLRGAFSRFYNNELIAMFESLGIETQMERGKRVFPLSMRANEIVEVLRKRLMALGVLIETNAKVLHIVASRGRSTGVETAEGTVDAGSVVLATGGASYPGTGSTGDGYKLAAALGHSIVEPLPALVPIELRGDVHSELDALSLENVNVSLSVAGKTVREEFGDILFTGFGVTGPAALSLGKYAAQNAGAADMLLIVNFKPALTREQLEARLMRDFAANGRKSIKEILSGLLPRRAVPVFIRLSGIPPERTGSNVSKRERAALAALLQGLTFEIKGVRPIAEAIVTSGGIALDEVSPKTLESKIVKGLFICGEVLDIDAETGGYNLQAAFSTGYIAGENSYYNINRKVAAK